MENVPLPSFSEVFAKFPDFSVSSCEPTTKEEFKKLFDCTFQHFSLAELLLEREKQEKWKDKEIFIFLDENGQEAESFSFKTLVSSAKKLALYLLKQGFYFCLILPKITKGVKYGDRIVLAHPPGLDFIKSFCACVLIGAISVPVFPPRPTNLGSDLSRLVGVVKNCDATV
jgi:acyl-CoA synthetase (AMP-forming)/AMP-acid ligase II